MQLVAGIDLGGTAINYTFVNDEEHFLREGLCEHPSLTRQGPEVCLQQIEDGLHIAAKLAGIEVSDIIAVGLDTPGPASASGVLCAGGPPNFLNASWGGFDIRMNLAHKLGKPVTYSNDANAGAIWGHYSLFGNNSKETSISVVIGTGTGGGVVIDGHAVKGRLGFGGELGHMLIPYQMISGIEGMKPLCNCGHIGDLESLASLTSIEKSLLPYFLKKYPDHELAKLGDLHKAAKLVRGLADAGDQLSREVFRVQAHAIGVLFDCMVNIFDPDAFIVGGGVMEASPAFRTWFLNEIRVGMPAQRVEQLDIPIYSMPNGDTAGARGAAIEALSMARATGLLKFAKSQAGR